LTHAEGRPAHPHRHKQWALGLSVALHFVAVGLIIQASDQALRERAPPKKEEVVFLADMQPAESPPAQPVSTPPPAPVPQPDLPAPRAPEPAAAPPDTADPPPPERAFMDAPPAPTAQEWALAATYTLKNSKRYRHNWGQQVRSLMGTAHEGPEQGAVRLRIEIAPSGQLARLDTLWTTSASVEQRARQAVQALPPLPPTPNGKPLIFEKTIVFNAFTAESPPLYKDDCLPDPPQHGNRFVWDGRSPQVVAAQAEPEQMDPEAYADCLKQLPQDTIEAEAASDKRQLEQWASPSLGR